jgi:hypothetical protein
MERMSPHGTIDRIGERRLDYDSITHTVALDLTRGSARACGRGVNGSDSTNSGATSSGTTGSASSGFSTERPLAPVVCTKWIE